MRKKKQTYRRAVKLSIEFATASKRRHISNLIEAYRGTMNRFIAHIWEHGGDLDSKTLAVVTGTRLSERFKSSALRHALSTVSSTRKAQAATGQRASRPHFTGSPLLDAKFVDIEVGRGAFDIVIRLSTLNKGQRITIPTKATAPLRKWLAMPGARLIQGCALRNNCIIVWVEMPLAFKPIDKVSGIDIGVNKLVTMHDGESELFFGREFRPIRDKIRRRQKGSAGIKRAYAERDNYFGRVLNQLPWKDISVVGTEDIKNMKLGKKKGRGKSFRRAMAPWTYRKVLMQIGQKAQEHRVLQVAVSPAYTSRTCPSCNKESKHNRKGEVFLCIACGLQGDADSIGAQNVRQRTLSVLASVESARLVKSRRMSESTIR